MQFIGRDQVAAPKLKDAKLSKDQLCSAYQQVIDGITNLYKYVIKILEPVLHLNTNMPSMRKRNEWY